MSCFFRTRPSSHRHSTNGRFSFVESPYRSQHPVGSFLDGGFFAVSQNDVIAFRAPDKEFQLTWFDRRGNSWVPLATWVFIPPSPFHQTTRGLPP